MNRGKYVLIEGGDGCGKSTQIALLKQYLDKKRIFHVTTTEPGGTEIGKIYKDILKGRISKEELTRKAEFFTFLANRSQIIKEIIKPNIEKGTWVISDRGFPSSFAYQGHGLGLDLDFVQSLNKYAITHQGVEYFPDIIFIIKIDPELGLAKSIDKSTFEKRGLDFQTKVSQGYLDFAERHKNITVVLPHEINNPQLTHSRIIKILEERFGI